MGPVPPTPPPPLFLRRCWTFSAENVGPVSDVVSPIPPFSFRLHCVRLAHLVIANGAFGKPGTSADPGRRFTGSWSWTS